MKAFVGFAGFGGPEIALREAGIETFGIEIDDTIAEVNRRNGGNVITADILSVDPAYFTGYDMAHFSPPCTPYSIARNSKARQDIVSRISDLAYHQSLVNGESEWDIRFARKICEFIRVVKPEFFTLENVWMYRHSRSWLLIWYTLLEAGYGVDAWNLNSADYGVPQSRRRMIAIARRDGRRPTKPWPTHSKTGDLFTNPWVGWYEAIEDLIPALPETQFAKWQIDKLPEELKTFILGQGSRSEPKSFDMPADTITANSNQIGIKALIIPGDNTSNNTIRQADEPMVTIQTRSISQCPHRAFIIGGQYQTAKNGKPRTVQNKGADSPIWTICASDHLDTRVYEFGRVVLISVRCLARFQGFPDWFVFPDNRRLACRGIGNALPPGLYRAILKSLGL